MAYRNDEPVDVNVHFKFAPRDGEAIKVISADEKEVWIPKAEIESGYDDDDKPSAGDELCLTIPMWLATDRGLI